jgi:hypothetical protein
MQDALVAALAKLLEDLGENALERHAGDGLMLTGDDPAWCHLCGALFTNHHDSRDISSPDDWRGSHAEGCAYVLAQAALQSAQIQP